MMDITDFRKANTETKLDYLYNEIENTREQLFVVALLASGTLIFLFLHVLGYG